MQAIPSNEDSYQFFTGTMDIDELDRSRELPQSPTVCHYFISKHNQNVCVVCTLSVLQQMRIFARCYAVIRF